MATVQIGVTLVGFLASAFAAVNLAGAAGASGLHRLGMSAATRQAAGCRVVITLVVGFVTLVVGEIAPKSLAMQHAERLALRFGGPISFLSVLALPAVKVVSFLSDLLVRPFGGHVKFSAPILTEEELKMLVEAGEEEGVIEEEEKEMIHSIFDFTDTVARQVMEPANRHGRRAGHQPPSTSCWTSSPPPATRASRSTRRTSTTSSAWSTQRTCCPCCGRTSARSTSRP